MTATSFVAVLEPVSGSSVVIVMFIVGDRRMRGPPVFSKEIQIAIGTFYNLPAEKTQANL